MWRYGPKRVQVGRTSMAHVQRIPTSIYGELPLATNQFCHGRMGTRLEG